VTSREVCVLLIVDEIAPRGMAAKYREKEGTHDKRVGDGQQHFGLERPKEVLALRDACRHGIAVIAGSR